PQHAVADRRDRRGAVREPLPRGGLGPGAGDPRREPEPVRGQSADDGHRSPGHADDALAAARADAGPPPDAAAELSLARAERAGERVPEPEPERVREPEPRRVPEPEPRRVPEPEPQRVREPGR